MNKQKFQKKNLHTINEDIKSHEVRLVGNGEPIVIRTIEALRMARNEEKDLILINENQNPPIAKIMDYKKFLYDTEKAEKERKKNSVKSILKEIQLSTDIADNDLNVKSKKAIEFLQKGDKVKCSLILKGRQRATPQRGELTMLKFATLVEEFGSLESLPILQGNRWNMMIKPKKKS
jgi:translation initiation factor IF-3